MAIAFVQAVASAAAATSVTLSITPTAGNTLIVILISETGSATLTVTDTTDSRSFAQVANSYGSSGFSGQTSAAFVLFNATGGGAKTITLATSGGAISVFGVCYEYSGVNSIENAKYNTQNSPGTGVDAITSGTYTANNAGDVILGQSLGQDVATAIAMAIGTSQAQRIKTTIVSNGNNRWLVGEDRATTGSVASTFTDATNGAGFVYDTVSVALSTVAATAPFEVLPITRFSSDRLRDIGAAFTGPNLLCTPPAAVPLMGQVWT